ncbi:MAG: pyrimidine/purine nucleoside phosphorylase [Akkermansiaceae bacterium]|nr:pyrimidine/purine nucleoside phosphorylase [Akkermansiaceae bacterium]NNM29821.1 pyrimidine/purine nucleoside phosphorylase [Akkermansiaceae bacterium]
MIFEDVTATALANIYFDGKVVSHSLTGADGRKITLGLVYPGKYHFDTAAAERMDITAGRCEVTLDDSEKKGTYEAGTYFDAPARSGFTIEVREGICQYVCTFLP